MWSHAVSRSSRSTGWRLRALSNLAAAQEEVVLLVHLLRAEQDLRADLEREEQLVRLEERAARRPVHKVRVVLVQLRMRSCRSSERADFSSDC